MTSLPTPQITLSEEQQQALTLIQEWLDYFPNKQEFRLGGFAGTGKTTLVKHLLSQLKSTTNVNIAAFTGKAVSVLGRKGISASTLHSLLYDVEIVKGEGYRFYPKSKLDGEPHLIIVDEASMVSTDLYNELVRHKTKLLFIGDPGQLEPVGENPNLMRETDFTLSKIHRQAEESPILSAATSIRQGGALKCPPNQDELILKKKAELTAELLTNFDQVICAKNATRNNWNAAIRQHLGFTSQPLSVNEKIIILRNSPQQGVFNGLLLWVDTIHAKRYDHWLVDCHDELGKRYFDLKVWKKPFQQEPITKGEFNPKGTVHADYGYVITCHKSQGSEWDKVLVIDEYMPTQVWDMKRWRYTAITRAAKQLTYCI